MVKSRNLEHPQVTSDIFKFKGENVGPEVDPVIHVTKDLMPPVSILRQAQDVGTGGGTNIYVPPTNEEEKDFYVTSLQLQLVQTVAGVGITPEVSIFLHVYNDTSTRQALTLMLPTNLVGQESTSLAYYPPIKIQRDTAISVFIGTGDANTFADGTVTGYYE